MSQEKSVEVVFVKEMTSIEHYVNLLDRAMNQRGELKNGSNDDWGKIAKVYYRSASITDPFAVQIAELQRKGVVDYARYA